MFIKDVQCRTVSSTLKIIYV